MPEEEKEIEFELLYAHVTNDVEVGSDEFTRLARLNFQPLLKAVSNLRGADDTVNHFVEVMSDLQIGDFAMFNVNGEDIWMQRVPTGEDVE